MIFACCQSQTRSRKVSKKKIEQQPTVFGFTAPLRERLLDPIATLRQTEMIGEKILPCSLESLYEK